jgi:hypothetical protein
MISSPGDAKSRFGLRLQGLIGLLISAGSPTRLALLGPDVSDHYPGIGSLFRGCSSVALTGSSLTSAASLCLRPEAALAAAPAGLTPTLASGMELEWIFRDVRRDGPPPCESVVIVRLSALQAIVASGAREAPSRGV